MVVQARAAARATVVYQISHGCQMDTLASLFRFLFKAVWTAIQMAIIGLLLVVLLLLLRPQQDPDLAVIVEQLASVSWLVIGFFFDAFNFLTNPRNAFLVIAVAVPLYHLAHVHNDNVDTRINALKGAAFDLVRLMEVTVDGTEKKAKILDDTVFRFAVTGPETIAKAFSGTATVADPPADAAPSAEKAAVMKYSPFQQVAVPSDLTKAAWDLMDRRSTDIGTFGANCATLRNGITVFLTLMEQKNISSSFTNITEHMKKQRDDAKKAPLNFADLKRFFYLPTAWPKDDEPENCQNKGLTWYQVTVILAALKHGRHKVLDVMKYNPPTPDGEKPITISGKNCLKSMRTYLYSAKTYDTTLKD